MRKTNSLARDRFLLGILIGIGVLVVAALILFFTRQGQITYGDDSTPAGALQNYFLAIQKRDYTRAYTYLADRPGKLGLDDFRRPFFSNQAGEITGTAVEIGETTLDQQKQMATVQVTILRAGQGLFDTGSRQQDAASLVRQNGDWKVLSAPYPYWPADQPVGAPPKLEISPTPAVTPTNTP